MLKRIASNTLAQLVAKFFGAGLTLLTTYATIRLAGLELYGDLTKILVLVALGTTAIDFGLNAEAIRSSRNQVELARNFQSVLVIRLGLSLLALLILNLVLLFLPGGYSPAVKSIFWLGSLSLIFQGIYTSSNLYFQYHLNYWRSTLSIIAGSLLTTLLTFAALLTTPSLPLLVLATTLGYLLLSIVALLLLPRPLFALPPLALVSRVFKRSLPLGLILVLSVLASKLDTILLSIFRSSQEVGQYGFAYRIFDVILVLPTFTMNAIYPLLVKRETPLESPHLLQRTTLAMGFLSVLLGLLVWVLAPALLYVKSELTLSVVALRYLALALPFFYLTSPLMWHLVSQKQDRSVMTTYALALAFNFTLNSLFLPHYGIPAAALITGLTELLIFLFLLYYSLTTYDQTPSSV